MVTFEAMVGKAQGYDLATKPESKKGNISHHTINELIGKKVKVTVEEVK